MQVNPTTYSTIWFQQRNNEKALILKPPYQRKPVWTPKQKAYLIDTILQDYIIPEIYIHRVTKADGNTIYNVVDGQQRIRSILEFLNDIFPLLEEFTPDYAEYTLSDLPDSLKAKIYNYIFYVREITNATEEEVRNLFKRMNRYVVPLNPQELRHATYQGDFIKLMEQLAEDEFWAENKIVTPNEIRRMNDVQFISDLFVSMIHGIQNKTKELDKYYEMYEADFSEKTKWHKIFDKIIEVIEELLPDLRHSRWKNKSDFYTLFMALCEVNNNNRYIPKTSYVKLRNDLSAFADKVSEATKKEHVPKVLSKNIKTYVNAVTKSTTDRDRRNDRHKIIYALVYKHSKNNQ
jgi:hypothetical protein